MCERALCEYLWGELANCAHMNKQTQKLQTPEYWAGGVGGGQMAGGWGMTVTITRCLPPPPPPNNPSIGLGMELAARTRLKFLTGRGAE